MKRSFTLLELILVVVIISFLSVATFEAIKTIKIKSFKAKELTRLSLESQVVLDQLSSLLRNRIPATAIGYNPDTNRWAYLDHLDTLSKDPPILEWIGYDEDALGNLRYSGFVDINRTLANSDHSIYTDVNLTASGYALIFSGSYDKGYEGGDLQNAFGWHGSRSDLSYDVSFTPEHTITIIDSTKPNWLYEKYFLVKTAYAVARSADVDKSAGCITDLGIGDDNDTLLLFYNYRPWKGETFCADQNGLPEGNATILMRNVQGFEFREEGGTIRLWIDINKTIPGNVGVHFSKMKVVW